MDSTLRWVVIALLILSFVLSVLAILVAFIKSKVSSERTKKSKIGSILIVIMLLVASVWCLRFAVTYSSVSLQESEQGLTTIEKIINCIFAAIRTFKLDEDYGAFILNLKELATELNAQNTTAQTLLIAYATVMNIVAPVIGGAVIIDILASIFPIIKMAFSYVEVWRKKYFFSELNETSLALAKGLLEGSKSSFKKPVIIFTDAYIDDENEESSELFLDAKSTGAICIKDDISHIRKNRYGQRAFFFMDEDESVNLQALTALFDEYNSPFMKNSEILYVTNSDAYIEIEKRINNKFKKEFNIPDEKKEDKEKKASKKSKKKERLDGSPIFIPIQSYRNLITDMLVEIPLFEPLIDKASDNDRKLTVTILGTGHIGTEMFLNTYWMGQILNCTLNINVVSEESEEEFWNKIDYVNPEIRHTTIANDPILTINRKGEMAQPYCNVNYFNCDAKSSAFIDSLNEYSESKIILDTDYFFVSLGTDELNISVSKTIKNAVGKYHITKNDTSKTVITYVVFDPTVAEVLNRETVFSFTGETADILMRAVGSLNEVYSVGNIFLDKYHSLAEQIEKSYLSAQGRKWRADTHKERLKDDYKYWADRAKGMHIKYKMFSMGILYDSVFNFDSLDNKMYKESVKTALDKYNQIAAGKIDFENTEEENAHISLLHKLAWLEHRRWNAFTRVKGFKHTNDYAVYAIPGDIGSYKQMELKLHPCLVECDDKGIRSGVTAQGDFGTNTIFDMPGNIDFDLLDDLSLDLYKAKYNNYDFKKYDYIF